MADEAIQRFRSKPARRCAYCHDHLACATAYVCRACKVRLHEGCAGELTHCPTLGCERAIPGYLLVDDASSEVQRYLILIRFGGALLWSLLALVLLVAAPYVKARPLPLMLIQGFAWITAAVLVWRFIQLCLHDLRRYRQRRRAQGPETS